MLKFPIVDLARNYLQNLQLYWSPSSRYVRETNVIVERLPYHAPFDAVFSFPNFVGLLLAAGIYALGAIMRERSFASSTALLLPALAIFAISVIRDKGENMRYKYFLEPVLTIFIFTQFDRALQHVRHMAGRWRQPAATVVSE